MVSMMPSGYNTDLFVSEVDENFKCPICFMVLKDPVELACEHAYCKACVLHHLNRGQGALCPQCRQPVGKRSDDSWAYDSPRRNFRNIHSNLRLRCDLDKCKKVCTIAELETHQGLCEFNPNRIIKCPKCQAQICAFDLNKHNCVEYLRARVEILQTTTSILESRIDALESNRVIGIKCVRLPENDKRRMFVESSDVLQDIREMFMKELDCDPWLYGVKCADIDTKSLLDVRKTVNDYRLKSGYTLKFSL